MQGQKQGVGRSEGDERDIQPTIPLVNFTTNSSVFFLQVYSLSANIATIGKIADSLWSTQTTSQIQILILRSPMITPDAR